LSRKQTPQIKSGVKWKQDSQKKKTRVKANKKKKNRKDAIMLPQLAEKLK
jgi:hypothetical protein